MRKLSLAILLLLSTSTFAAGRPIAPRGSAPTSYLVSEPLVAFAGERFLTVWTENMGNIGVHVMGTLRDATGRPTAPIAFPILESFDGTVIQLVGAGDSYALFWRNDAGDTFLTDVALDGIVLRTTPLALPRNIAIHAGWNGSRFLVAVRYFVNGQLAVEGFLLTRAGEIVRREIAFDPNANSFDIIADGDGFAAATTSPHTVTAYRITSGGDLTSYAIAEDANVDRPLVSIASDGNLLVVWAALEKLQARVLTPAGNVVFRDAIASSLLPLYAVNLRRIGDAHLVTYLAFSEPDAGIFTVILHDSGAITRTAGPVVDLAPRTFALVSAAASPEVTLVVYERPIIYPRQLQQVTIADDATATQPEPVAIERARQSQPILANAGGTVLAAWTDIQGAAAFIRTASLAPEAAPLTDTIVAPAFTASRELAWNGTEYLTVTSRNQELRAQRLTVDGRPIDATPIVIGQHWEQWWSLNAAVTWAGDRWAIVWEAVDGLYFVTIRDGAASTPKKLSTDDFVAMTDPALSFNGSTLLLVWNETDYSNCTFFPPCAPNNNGAIAARITLDGDIGKRLPVAQGTDYSIATSGNEFFISGGSNATIVDSTASNVIVSRPVFTWPATSDVTWDGSSYAVALRYRGTVWHLSVTHYDRNLNVVGLPRGTITLPPDNVVAPSIAGGMIGVQEGDAVNGARAVVYLENELQPLPARPATPLNVRATPIGNGLYTITWDEVPGAELYRVLLYGLGSGIVVEIHDVPATEPRQIVASSAAAHVIAFNAAGTSEPLPRRRASRR
jgi:hypothetical protein